MTIKRRLSDLKNRPSRQPSRQPSRKSASTSPDEIEKSIRRKLSLPLPASATADEITRVIALLKTAVLRLKADPSDTAGFDDVKTFAQSVHAKVSG